MPRKKKPDDEAFVTPEGEDPILDMMREDGIPLTRENYIFWNWPEGEPEWNAELEGELPPEIRADHPWQPDEYEDLDDPEAESDQDGSDDGCAGRG